MGVFLYMYTTGYKDSVEDRKYNYFTLYSKTDVDERGDRVGDRRKLSSSAKLTSNKQLNMFL